MMKSFLFVLVALLVLSSCGKKRSIHIRAVNAATGEVYGGLEYVVVSSRTTSNGEKYRTEASGNLDSNGEVLVEVKQKTGRTYSIRVTEPPNSCYNKQITQFFDTQYDQNGTFTFEFAPCARLQRIVKNVACIDSSDKIEIYIDNSLHTLLTNAWILDGCADFTTNPTDVPIGTYDLHWIVTKNGNSADYYDSFTLVENEFKVHEIQY